MGKEALRIGNNIFFALIFLNLLFLNLWVMGYVKPLIQAATVSNAPTVQTNEAQESGASNVICGTECVDKIYQTIQEATSSASLITQSASTLTTGSVSQNSSREYIIPLGSGTNSTTIWTNVPGAAAYIDNSNYGTIQSVTFQASLFVPTGNQIAYVQLFDVTQGHPVWFSSMSMSGGSPQLLISNPITLDPGNNLYQVQMMSQLGFPTNLVTASVNIIGN